VTLCRRLKKLPLVKEKVKSGELGYTAARVLVPVIDETNEKGWLDFALNNSRRDLEREVKRARKEALEKAAGQQTLLPVPSKRPAAVVPVRVSLAMTPTQFARYEGLWERIRKQSDVPTDGVEALLEIMESFAGVIALRDRAAIQTTPRGGKSSVAKPPVQIHIHECPECSISTVQTNKGELEIGEAELERAHCDCQIDRPNERNTASIPPATRRKVLAHYRHKCQRPGCGYTRYLEVHHKIPRSQGGSNAQNNLACLCSACHTLLHDNNLEKNGFWVKSPPPIYQWQSGALKTEVGPSLPHSAPNAKFPRSGRFRTSSNPNPPLRQDDHAQVQRRRHPRA